MVNSREQLARFEAEKTSSSSLKATSDALSALDPFQVDQSSPNPSPPHPYGHHPDWQTELEPEVMGIRV